ncbi:MAG: chromate transporter [Treponemataceae bacterium]|nr:MAG: chromate transporter [Treponemataceae bacterium]
MRELLELVFVFFKIGAVTFGGGIAMLPILERELTVKRDWATADDLLDYYAIGQVTPGIIAVNVATFIGCKRKGVAGGIAATIGIVLPSLLIITLIARLVDNFADLPLVKNALTGINTGVAALLTVSVISFSKKTILSRVHLLLCVAAFGLIVFAKVNPIFVITGAIALGIFLHFMPHTRK